MGGIGLHYPCNRPAANHDEVQVSSIIPQPLAALAKRIPLPGSQGARRIRGKIPLRTLYAMPRQAYSPPPSPGVCSASPFFVPGLPHVMLIELRQALISYQDNHNYFLCR